MKNFICELKNALKSKLFYLNCIIPTVLSLILAFHSIQSFKINSVPVLNEIQSGNIHFNPMIQNYSIFNLWIGATNENIIKTILFYAFPLVAAIAYGWSFRNDREVLYSIGKKEYKKYCMSRYFTIFITSGLTLAIPLIVNLLTILLFVPVIYPDSAYDIYFGIFSYHFASDLFYSAPFLHTGIFILFAFVYSGLIGCLSYAFYTVYNNRIIAIIITYIIFFIINWKNDDISSLITTSNELTVSPILFLSSARLAFLNVNVYMIEIIILFIYSFTTVFFSNMNVLQNKESKGNKDEK